MNTLNMSGKYSEGLRSYGIKLKAKKCDLSKKEVKHLGRIVSQESYRADPENIKNIVSLKERTPKTVGEIPKKTQEEYPTPYSTLVSWSEEHQGALNFPNNCLTTPTVMAYLDYEIPFVLHTDASQEGLCAVLYHKQQGIMHVIGYASRTLTPVKTKYHLHSGKL